MALKIFKTDDNEVVGVSSRIDKMFKNLSRSKKSKNKKFKNLNYIVAMEKLIFLTLNTKNAFNYLR